MQDLSQYNEIYNYDNKRSLVRNAVTGDVRIRKTLSHYDESAYVYLRDSNNKHIPKIFELNKDSEGNLIVIEEFIQGNNFDIVLNSHSIPEKTKLKYFSDLLEGLTFLHSAPNPVIHGDLNPSNIMLAENGEVVILNYDASKTNKPDPRSDIYAVGKMLSAAFPNNSRIQKIAEKASSTDPENRYPSAKILSEVLGGKLSPSLRLKPLFPPPGFRTRKWWKMLLAIVSYLFMIETCINYHSSDNPVVNNLNRVVLILTFLFSIDICNSWTGIFDVLPFVTHKDLYLRSLFKFLFIVSFYFTLGFIVSIVMVAMGYKT